MFQQRKGAVEVAQSQIGLREHLLGLRVAPVVLAGSRDQRRCLALHFLAMAKTCFHPDQVVSQEKALVAFVP